MNIKAGLDDSIAKKIGLLLRDFGITFEKRVLVEQKEIVVKSLDDLFEQEPMVSIAEKTGISIHTITRIKKTNSSFNEKTAQAFLKAYPTLDFSSFEHRIYKIKVAPVCCKKQIDIFDFIERNL